MQYFIATPSFDYFVYIRIIISLLSGLPYKQKIQVTCLAITCIVLTYHQLKKNLQFFFEKEGSEHNIYNMH